MRLGTLVYNHGQKKPERIFSYIDIGSIDNANQKLSSDENLIEADKAPSRARKIVKTGDIIYSTVRPYLHNMCIINKDFSFEPIASTGFAVMTSHADFVNEFLFLYMMSPDFDAYANDTDNSKGVAYPAINDERLYRAFIPVPPVSEQKRIIEKYTSLKPYINKYGNAEEKLTSLNGNFPEQLKKSILQEAVMGKLVPQDKNDEPASVLLERIRKEKQRLIAEGKLKKDKHESIIYRRDNSHYEKLDGVERCIDDEIPFEIPETWSWCHIGNIAFVTKLAGFEYTKNIAPNLVSEGVPLFKGKNVQNGQLIYEFEGFIPEELSDELERSQINKKCLLTPYVGTIGNIAIFPGDFKAHLGSNVGKIEIIKNLILEEYVMYYFRSDLGYKELTKHKKATVQESISIEAIRDAYIPIPPFAEQKSIVNKIELLFSTCNNL